MAEERRDPATGGDGREGAADGTNVASGTGESGGGARKGQGAHGDGGEDAGFTGHGGQSDIDYFGPGHLGGKTIDNAPNLNAVTEDR